MCVCVCVCLSVITCKIVGKIGHAKKLRNGYCPQADIILPNLPEMPQEAKQAWVNRTGSISPTSLTAKNQTFEFKRGS